MRKTKEELDELLKSEKCDRLWSWSKINCFHTSPYEYYLHYIKKVKEDKANSIYVTTGGLAHQALEDYYTDKIAFEEMLDRFEDGWVMATEIAELKFDRTDEAKNESIKEKYYKNLQHFFQNHSVIKDKPAIEEFIKIKVDGNLFQGYIDCSFKDDEGNTHIVDFKTSSIYTGAKAENECGQLVLYAIGLNQQGVPMDKIKICWNFLKYVNIQYQQKNGDIKVRQVERREIGEKLMSNVKMWLKHFGYNPDDYIGQLIDTNSIECLPEEVKEKYVISDCYVYVPLTDKLIERWETHIKNIILDITMREKDYEETLSDKCFWDSEESVAKESYYFANLCGYSAHLHKPYGEYLDRFEKRKNDLFGGLLMGDEYEEPVNKEVKKQEDEVDLSWLDDIEL